MAHRSSGNPFIRSALRQVRDTLPRFLSILFITIIGVAFFAGLRLTGPYMKTSADQWYNERNFMDIQLFSTMGFDEDDIAALRSTTGVTRVAPGYNTNVLVSRNGYEISVQFLSLDPGYYDKDGTAANPSSAIPLNSPELLSGRLPTSPNECLAEARWLRASNNSLGGTVKVLSGTSAPLSDRLAYDEFTVVGTVKSPLFITDDRGNSEIGSGRNAYFFLVMPEAFTLKVYTTAYLQVGSSDSRFTTSYFRTVGPVVDALEETGELRSQQRYDQIMTDAHSEFADARTKIADGYQALIDAEAELEDARLLLADGWAELEDGRAELDSGWTELYASRSQLDSGWAESDAGRVQLDENWDKMNASRAWLDLGWSELATARIALDEGWEEYHLQFAQLQYAQSLGLLTPQEYAAALQQLEDARLELEKAEVELAQGEQELDAAEVAYKGGVDGLQAGEAAYQAGLQKLYAGEAAYQGGLQMLLNGEDLYASGLEEYLDAKALFEDGLATFEKERPDALADLAQATADLDQAEEDLKALKPPSWYILDLDSNAGFRSYKQESEQLEAIATVLPLLFFLIAALVSMTSMTRLVDNDRTIIGTYKALGYTNAAITARYLGYAFSASLIGGVIGIIVGYNLFPPLIFNAFHTMYTVPPAPALFSWPYATLSLGVALLSTVGPAALVSLRTLHETPASAMRPLAPRPGKRNILERIKPLWRRFSFLHKVTLRNLLRYKKRAFMTVFGVAGCTALMFTGFGLNDSLGTLGPKQYGEIQRYDIGISFRANANDEDLNQLHSFLQQSPELSSYTLVRRETADIVGESLTKNLAILIPMDPGVFQDYYTLRPRVEGGILPSKQRFVLSDNGVILTEQIARQIGVTAGDTITLRNLNNIEAQFTVDGVMENYVYHFVIMTPASYERAFDEQPKPNQALGLLASGTGSENSREDNSDVDTDNLTTTLTDFAAVTGVSYMQRAANDFSNITDVLGFVMAILILSAAALACVVLFSLNTINREERTRELASIKVLGFFNRELAAYIYREGFILTAIGIALGLLLGIALERYIITTIEIDAFMFSRDLLFTSYFYSALLTAGFALLVNLLLYRPLTNIDMVSSLKAVE
ncbi:MAG: FtsX-like permease family protein [Coriobacteriia bacterium]|nr:FtsX-like permease family protein [Coriobacteriia bacterium]